MGSLAYGQKKKVIDMIDLDFHKAFDIVWHEFSTSREIGLKANHRRDNLKKKEKEKDFEFNIKNLFWERKSDWSLSGTCPTCPGPAPFPNFLTIQAS